MRIAIDARMMGPENTRGIGRYIEELVRAMLEVEPEHEYILVTRQAAHVFSQHPSVKTLVADIPWYGMREQREMSKILKSIGADIVHVPHWNVPLFFKAKFVATIHDLLLMHDPGSTKSSTRAWPIRVAKQIGYRVVLGRAIRQARRILVPTKFVQKDVAAYFPEAASRIRVTGEGMPRVHIFSDEHPHQPPFLLYVGSAYPHKGLGDLLEAWKKIVLQQPELELWIVGEKDVFMQRIWERVEASQLPRVRFLGRISDSELTKCYQQAMAFVFPSHFEGFGLPPLEAMANGCPVIVSDAGALPEVLGNEGVFSFHVGDSDGILDRVQEILRDPMDARVKTAKAAEKLAERHQWRTAAEHTLQAYREAIS